MASRPLVLPEPFSGEGSWESWLYHFESVADVNDWDDGKKLKWLKVRLTGKAQTAFQRLPEEARADYKEAKKALQERFEPKSRQSRFHAEFQTRTKRKSESWADFADELKSLVDKAYPELEEAARERLAVNQYLQQLEHPQVAFSVKQKRPAKLDEAVSATLEMEAYTLKPGRVVASVQGEEEREGESAVAVVGAQDPLAVAVERLTARLQKLESECFLPRQYSSRQYTGRPAPRGGQGTGPTGGRSQFRGKCWRCGTPGHLARDCSQNPPSTGN